MSALVRAADLLPEHLRGVARAVRLEPAGAMLLAFLCEAPVLFVRGVLLTLALPVLMAMIEVNLGFYGNEMLILSLLILWPLLALICPFPSGWWWKQAEGGRDPSERERLAYQDSIETLQARSTRPLLLPAAWFVIDSPEPNAAVCADTLMLTRGLLESEFLPAVIAHELGHLASSDGRLSAAINRLIVLRRPREPGAYARYAIDGGPPIGYRDEPNPVELPFIFAAWIIRLLFASLRFSRGGWGLTLTAGLWGSYWRAREYHADDYAATLGQAEELAEFLEIHALIHDHPIPFIWMSEHTHPPSELRIDRLRAHADSQQSTPALPAPTR